MLRILKVSVIGKVALMSTVKMQSCVAIFHYRQINPCIEVEKCESR